VPQGTAAEWCPVSGVRFPSVAGGAGDRALSSGVGGPRSEVRSRRSEFLTSDFRSPTSDLGSSDPRQSSCDRTPDTALWRRRSKARGRREPAWERYVPGREPVERGRKDVRRYARESKRAHRMNSPVSSRISEHFSARISSISSSSVSGKFGGGNTFTRPSSSSYRRVMDLTNSSSTLATDSFHLPRCTKGGDLAVLFVLHEEELWPQAAVSGVRFPVSIVLSPPDFLGMGEHLLTGVILRSTSGCDTKVQKQAAEAVFRAGR